MFSLVAATRLATQRSSLFFQNARCAHTKGFFETGSGREVPFYNVSPDYGSVKPTQSSIITYDSPTVIVLQEWWGVNDEILSQAQRIANKGYNAIVPDLYHGKKSLEIAEAEHLMNNLDWDGAVKDIAAVVEVLRAENPHRKIGIIGFCMGGALSLAACGRLKNSNERLNAGVAFYGIPPAELASPEQIARVGVPLQLHFGEKDVMEGFSDPKSAKAFESNLKKQGHGDHKLFIYSGQGHAFMNTSKWSKEKRVEMGLPPMDVSTIDTAWTRVFDFYDKHLN